jgi:outer membrane protein assembly factor BamB
MQPVIFVLILASIFLAACGAQVASQNWPGVVAQGDHVYTAYGVGVAAIDVAEESLVWTFPDELNPALLFYATPSLNEDRIIVGDYGASGGLFSPRATVTIYALEHSAESAAPSILWTSDSVALDRIVAPPEQTEDQVFVGTADNHLFALDAADGSVQWEFETGHSIWAQPLYNEGTVYVASLDNSVYALDAASGELLWQQELSGSIASRPALNDGLLYVPSFDRAVHALDAATGEEQWVAEAQNWVWGSPVLGDGTVYYGDIDGNVYAVGADSGEQSWTQTVTGAVQSTPLYVDGTLFVTAGETEGDEEERLGQLVALDAESGEELWVRETPAPIFTRPVQVNENIVVIFQDAGATIMQVYQADNGALIWDMTLPSES